jgi:hypothetical protein
MRAPPWTSEMDALMTSLWLSGYSQQAASKEMQRRGHNNITPSMVAGRLHRIRASGVVCKRPHLQRGRIRQRGIKRGIVMATEPISMEGLCWLEGVAYLDNTENGCKAILDKRSDDKHRLQMVCGLPRAEEYIGGCKSPYCRAHLRIYISPTAVVRRSYG